MTETLISPLGRSPGAVSGVYFGLLKKNRTISQVITVGTSHKDVLTASRTYLTPLFKELGVSYEAVHLPDEELRGKKQSVGPYASMVGLKIEETIQSGAQAHVAVTAGRSGMGALAAIAGQLYGATALWHLWVPLEIEQMGTLDALGGIAIAPSEMVGSPAFNPTVAGSDSWDLVSLPFLDLRPMHDMLYIYRRTGQVPGKDSPLVAVLLQSRAASFSEIFPAGMTFAQADEVLALKATIGSAQSPEDLATAYAELGATLQRSGIVDAQDRERLVRVLARNGSAQEMLEAVKRDPLGFWDKIRNNREMITLGMTAVNTLLTALELWLKGTGRIT